jgi:hypothetical protein
MGVIMMYLKYLSMNLPITLRIPSAGWSYPLKPFVALFSMSFRSFNI